MDDDGGYPYFRKPPYELHYSDLQADSKDDVPITYSKSKV